MLMLSKHVVTIWLCTLSMRIVTYLIEYLGEFVFIFKTILDYESGDQMGSFDAKNCHRKSHAWAPLSFSYCRVSGWVPRRLPEPHRNYLLIRQTAGSAGLLPHYHVASIWSIGFVSEHLQYLMTRWGGGAADCSTAVPASNPDLSQTTANHANF